MSVEAEEGEAVREGQLLVVMEAMKMEHEVRARDDSAASCSRIVVSVGDTIWEGNPLVFIEEAAVDVTDDGEPNEEIDLDHIRRRPEAGRSTERRATTLDDERRGWAVERRRRTKGQRTVAVRASSQLFDDGSMVEYGPARARRPTAAAVARSPS